jgi:hypothetical protein
VLVDGFCSFATLQSHVLWILLIEELCCNLLKEKTGSIILLKGHREKKSRWVSPLYQVKMVQLITIASHYRYRRYMSKKEASAIHVALFYCSAPAPALIR